MIGEIIGQQPVQEGRCHVLAIVYPAIFPVAPCGDLARTRPEGDDLPGLLTLSCLARRRVLSPGIGLRFSTVDVVRHLLEPPDDRPVLAERLE